MDQRVGGGAYGPLSTNHKRSITNETRQPRWRTVDRFNMCLPDGYKFLVILSGVSAFVTLTFDL